MSVQENQINIIVLTVHTFVNIFTGSTLNIYQHKEYESGLIYHVGHIMKTRNKGSEYICILAEIITWCFFVPGLKPLHVAVACPRVPVEMQVLQLRHCGHEARRKRRQLIVRQVEVF